MSVLTDFLARAAIHISIFVLSLALLAIVFFGCLIGIGGTGGFTSS